MSDARDVGKPFPRVAELGLVLSVLCLGLSAGVLATSGRGKSGTAGVLAAGASPSRATATPAGVRVGADTEVVRDSGGVEPGPGPVGGLGSYRPVSGAQVDSAMSALEFVPRDGEAGEEVGDSEAARSTGAGNRGGDVTSSVPGDGAGRGSSPILPDVDHVAALPRRMAAGALLFAVSSGGETVVYDVGVPGARQLPDNIAGRWAWIGSCQRLHVEVSQLPGATNGAVRGVGATEDVTSRFGWVVPAAGCSGAGAGVRVASSELPGSTPSDIADLRTVGRAPCVFARYCDWFAGVSAGGRVVGLLARAGGDHWVRLGGGP